MKNMNQKRVFGSKMAAQTKIIKCVIKLELKIEMLQNLNANETLCIHLIFNMYKYN